MSSVAYRLAYRFRSDPRALIRSMLSRLKGRWLALRAVRNRGSGAATNDLLHEGISLYLADESTWHMECVTAGRRPFAGFTDAFRPVLRRSGATAGRSEGSRYFPASWLAD